MKKSFITSGPGGVSTTFKDLSNCFMYKFGELA